MQRYFGKLLGKNVILSDDDFFHISKVMRAKVGDNIEVVCDKKPYLCKIESFKPFKVLTLKQLKEVRELPNKIILVCAVLKGEKMDLVLQKATELGVTEIVLLSTERTVVKTDEFSRKKFERFERIVKEASEQSHRTSIPVINRLIHLNELNKINANIKLIPYELKAGSTKSFWTEMKKIKSNDTIAIVIGPEGGFAEYEVDLAIEKGFVPISLGRRILRAETAVFYALSVLSNYLEKE